ncbi:MAG: RES family NAD+ phosphorylase [Actinomycetota bacterium]|nr:RES family NAD+ phosphorylase [Actinomycetota bacterium]
MRVQHLELHDTMRLIDSRHDTEASHALHALTDDDAETTAVLVDLVRVTSARTQAELGQNPAFARNVLVAGVPLAAVINAAFTYPSGTGFGGGRFNREQFGAWYCSDGLDAAKAEVAFHRARFLQQSRIDQAEMAFTVYLADVNGDLAVLAARADAEYLHPDSYVASQNFADECRARQLSGIRYPSVRLAGALNTAVLIPHLVQHVRRSNTYAAHWDGSSMQWHQIK